MFQTIGLLGKQEGDTTTAVTGLQWGLSVQFQVASDQRRPVFSDSLAAMVLALRPFHGYRSRYLTLPYNGPLTDDLKGVEYDPTQYLDAPGSSRQVSLVCNRVLCVLPENTTNRRKQATQNNKTEIKRLGLPRHEKLKRVRRCWARPAPCHKRYR